MFSFNVQYQIQWKRYRGFQRPKVRSLHVEAIEKAAVEGLSRAWISNLGFLI